MSKNTCPICGKPVDDFAAEFLDNGSPAHPECVKLEARHSESKENTEKEKK